MMPEPRDRTEETALRDALAADRTDMANERTLLAYVRTGLAFLAVGGTCLKVFDTVPMRLTGGLCLVAGAIILAAGVVRFRHWRRRARSLFHGGR